MTTPWESNERLFRQVESLRREEQPRRKQELRDRFLTPPRPDGPAPALPELLKQAESAASRARGAETRETARMIMEEARCSSLIESVFELEEIFLHERALLEFVDAGPGEKALLEFHATSMRLHADMAPGQYRHCNVIVGNHAGPPHERVPELMDGLWNYLENSKESTTVKAAAVHLVFETIHPFTDGNGRSGRALCSAVIGSALPVSRAIMEDRYEYYTQLDSPELDRWTQYWLGLIVRAGKER